MTRFLPATPWERNQWVTTAMVFVVFMGFAFVIPFLPLYVRELGVRDPEQATLWAGVLIGIAPLLAGLLAPVWGRLADRYGQKPMAIRALAASAFFLLLSANVRNVEQLLACRIGTGLFGGIGPLGLAMATSIAPREHTGRAVGLIQAAQILAAAVGPLGGGLLADRVGRRATFAFTSLLCLAALVLVVRLYEEAPRATRSTSEAEPTLSFLGVLRTTGVPSLLVLLFLVNFVGRAITPILPSHLERLGVAAGPARLVHGTAHLRVCGDGRGLGHPPRTGCAHALAAGAARGQPPRGGGYRPAHGAGGVVSGLLRAGRTPGPRLGGRAHPLLHDGRLARPGRASVDRVRFLLHGRALRRSRKPVRGRRRGRAGRPRRRLSDECRPLRRRGPRSPAGSAPGRRPRRPRRLRTEGAPPG